ncbi:hypothetical protein DEU56DRAFT_713740, partial [Suillus clintonianus]|uniref:uncharacterized protein n=1 Tax=Suillus clintonianus TaxID=1904413 RepID=UPI001B86CBD2
HQTFWLTDGNTTLEIGGVLFKLHRSRLADQSTFFAGLLDEQDVRVDDSVKVESDENGTVYHLSNTTSKDFEALLQFDRNPMVYYLTPPPFSVLAAILRASTALGFDAHRAYAVKLLENGWSSSLADLTKDTKPHAVGVAVLGRSCGIESVLKRAFYEMVRAAGYGLGNGELDGGDVEEISRADERRLGRMRESLTSTWLQVAMRLDRSLECPNQPKGRRVHDSGLYNEYLYDPLCGLEALIKIKWDKDEGWCTDCVQARRKVWILARQRTWQ